MYTQYLVLGLVMGSYLSGLCCGKAESAIERSLSSQVTAAATLAIPAPILIDAASLKALIDATPSYNDPEKCPFIVVNVLGNKLYTDCHIAGSINAPLYDLYQITLEWNMKGWLASKEIIVYCALDECDASLKAYYMLKGMGVERVRAYEGGIREWNLLNYPVSGECAFEYLRSGPCLEECRKMVIEECGSNESTVAK